MIKVKVMNKFVDKYTNELYEINQILEVTEKRYEEIKKYVELFEEIVKKSDRRKGKELEN
mgnify:FL=1